MTHLKILHRGGRYDEKDEYDLVERNNFYKFNGMLGAEKNQTSTDESNGFNPWTDVTDHSMSWHPVDITE